MKQTSRKIFGSFIFDGIITILLGVAMIIWPGEALKFVFIIGGIVLAVFGLIKSIVCFADKKREHSLTEHVAGICEILLGIALAAFSGFFIKIFHYFIAIILAFSAVVLLVHAITIRKEGGPMMILSFVFAVLSASLSVPLFIKPVWIAQFEVRLGGIAFIIEGLAMIIFFRKIKKVKDYAKVIVVEEIEKKEGSER